MSADGSVIIDTDLDQSGLRTGLANLGSTLTSGIATAVAAAGAALVGLGAYAISVGSDFEYAISGVAATMGKTTEEISILADKAKELGASTKFTATEAAEGFNILAMAGLSLDEQLQAIDATLALASAGEMNMDAAAGYLTTTVKAMSTSFREAGINMNDCARIADMYAKGATLANTSTEQLGEAVSTAASLGGSYNQSLTTITTSLLALAEKGYQGSAAGNYLARAMSDLYSPTANAKTALDELGVAIYDADGKQRDFIDIVNDLNTAFGDLTEEEKAAYTGTIFTTAGLKAFNSIAGNSAEQLADLKGKLEDCEGAAQAMADTKLDNLQGDITILQSATEGFGIALYGALSGIGEGTGMMRDFVQEATDIMSDLTAAVNEGGFDGLVDAIGDALARVVNKIVEYVPMLIQGGVRIVSSLVKGIAASAGDIANSAASLLSIFVEGILDIVENLVELGGELIIALADGLSQNSGELINSIAKGLVGISKKIVSYLPKLIDAGINLVKSVAKGILNAIPVLLDALPDVIESLVDSLIDAVPELLDCVTEIIDAIADELPNIITTIVNALPNLIQKIVNGLTTLIPKLIECVVHIVDAIVKALPQVITAILEALPNIITTIIDGLKELIPALVNGVITLLMSIVDALPVIIDAIVDALPSIISALIDGLLSLIPQLFDAAITLLMAIVDAIPEIITSLVQELPKIVTTIVTTLLSKIPDIVQAAIDLFGGILEAIPDIVTAIVKAMPEIIGAIVSGLVNGVGSVLKAAGELFGIIPKSADDATQSISDHIASLGDYASKFDDITPKLADYNQLLSDQGHTLDELDDQTKDVEDAITEILRGALEEQRGLRDDEIADIENYLDELTRLQDEKLSIYRSQQLSELRKLQLEAESISAKDTAQYLANLEETLKKSNELSEEMYASELTDIERLWAAGAIATESEYKRRLEAAKKNNEARKAENESFYNDAITVLQEKAEKMVDVEDEGWLKLRSNAQSARKGYSEEQEDWQVKVGHSIKGYWDDQEAAFTSAFNDLDVASANGYLQMLATIRENGGRITDENIEIAKGILAAFYNLPPELQDEGKEALLGLIAGMDDEIPALKNASRMSANEIVETLLFEVVYNKNNTKSIGEQAIEGMADGMSSKESFIRKKASDLANGVLNAMKTTLQISSPSKAFKNEIGKNSILGLADGLTENAKYAVAAAQSVAKDIADVDFSLDYDGDDESYKEIEIRMKRTIENVSSDVGTAISAGTAAKAYNSHDNDEHDGNSLREGRPEFIQNDIYLDGKKTARVITPYISQELEWERR